MSRDFTYHRGGYDDYDHSDEEVYCSPRDHLNYDVFKEIIGEGKS